MRSSRWGFAADLPPASRRRVTWLVRVAAGADLVAGAALLLAENHAVDGTAWVQLATAGMTAALAITMLGGAALHAGSPEPREARVTPRLTRPTRAMRRS